MMDKKKIKKAAKKYGNRMMVSCNEFAKKHESTIPTVGIVSIAPDVAFQDGVKWAINEFSKDLWHPVSEEPEENKKLLVQYTNYMMEDDYEIDMNSPHVPWRYFVTAYNFKKWCYIEDLLPKGGEK